jgi:hypothetical protein
MEDREKRMAQNEALFREVNERVNDLVPGFAVVDTAYEYLCECANVDCTFRVSVDPDEYEAVRRDPAQFLVLPLHFTPEVEELVAKHDAYWVVRKTGEAAEYVSHLDPRSR